MARQWIISTAPPPMSHSGISKGNTSSSRAKNCWMNVGPILQSLAWKRSRPWKSHPPPLRLPLSLRMALSNLIDGRAIAEQLHAETSQRIEQLKKRGIEPGLAFVRVGEDPASKVYVGMKERTSSRLGIRSVTKVLDEKTTEEQLLGLIGRLNADPSIHGILVQAPLPPPI